jgi:hypothetical protein
MTTTSIEKKEIVGKFYDTDGKPAAYATLSLGLSEDSIVRGSSSIGPGEIECEHTWLYDPHAPMMRGCEKCGARLVKAEWRDIILDHNGEISPDTQIWGNDELEGATYYGTFLSMPKTVGGRYGGPYPQLGSLEIAGESPIDINKLVPLPEPEPEPEPKEWKPPSLHETRQMELNAASFVRERKLNGLGRKHAAAAVPVSYAGFYGGIIYPPASVGLASISPYVSVDHTAGIAFLLFHLPFDTTVTRASVIVDKACPGKTVVVGLYDANREKVCAIGIDVSDRSGRGTFHTPVTLRAGDHFLAWGMPKGDGSVKLLGMNLALVSVRETHGGSDRLFPETLGKGHGSSQGVPLVYFD